MPDKPKSKEPTPIQELLAGTDNQNPFEVTPLSPMEEVLFRMWHLKNKITDVDKAPYDYRGFWKEHGPVNMRFGVDHFPDTYKQHGHETFSQESKYSKGAFDGGMWLDEIFLPQPKMSGK